MKHNGPWLSALTAASAGVLVAMASASAALPPVAMADSVEQPNILLINLDDLRGAGTLPVMPRVRAYFQDSGRTYTENYVSTPLCSPSRASLFTGRFPHNNGVTGNGLDAEIAALDQSATFQSYLQEDGYNTAMAGKYMNTVPLSRSPQYWDRWLFTTGGYSDINYNDDGTVHRLPGYYTDVLGDHVVEYLNDFERSDDQPWLIYVAPQAPHAPTTPSDPYTSATVPAWDYPGNFNEADIADKPSSVRWRGLLDPTVVEQTRKQQLRTLMSVDDLVGQITDEMARLGEDERTLAIFTSDNGYQWGEHRLDSKRFPYTDGVSVPLLVRWPGHIAPGSVDSRLVSNVDVLPTLLQASGVSPQLKYPLDGVSFLSDTRRSDLLLEYGRSLDSPLAPWASIRTESEQFTEWYNATTGALTEREYYNLSTDPLQLVNLLRDGTAANDPDVDSWSARLANLRQCAGNDCLVVDSEVNSPPTAQMAVPSCTALACDFSATGSSDRDGLIVDYRWEFGDGGTAQGATTTHTYAASGTYPVKVTVTDDDGATASASRSVSVSDSDSTSALDFRAGTSATNNTKRLVVTVPPSARAGDALLLFVSANRNNVTPTVPTGWTRLDHVMDSTMQSDVWWRVANSSDAGASVPITANLITKMDAQLLAYSGTRSPPVLVHSAAVEPGYTAAHRTPTVSVPSTGAWLVSYWADKSSAGSGWSEPAGTVRRLQSVGTGSGRITSLSTDSGSPVPIGTSGGLTATSSTSSDMATMWTIALTPGVVDSEVNSPPTAQMAVPSCTALACDFSATGSSDRDGLIVDYRWEFGDGGTAQGATTTHTYAASGTYPVKVTVTDDDGATASASRSVSVSDSDSTSALDFRAGTSATNNTKRLVVTVPPSARAGDALLLFVSANRNNVTPTVPTGWTRLDHVMDSTMQSDVWWRVANSSDAGASVPITANLITKMDAQLLAYSGTRSPPVLVHSAAVEPGYTAAHRTPTVSVPSTGAWLVSYWADKSSAGSGWSEPAGTVRRLQSVGTGSGRITSLSTDSGSPVPIGTSGGLTATSSTSSDMATMWTIALTPGVSSTPAREFVDEAVRAGIYEVNESWEAEPVDFDSDGDMDLWIGFHDQGGKLWSNDGDGTFSRIATSAWPKVNAAGRIPDRHDCAWADVDQDGRIDAYCTAGRGSNNPVKYDRENELWLQLAPGTFTEVGQQWGVGELCGRSHYAAFLDANGDAYPDLYVGNAPPRDDPSDPCDDPQNELPTEESKLFLNEAGEALVPSTTMGIEGYGGVRCAEVVDYDGDGWDDLLLCGTPATYLYRNLGGTGFQNVAPSQGFGGVVTDGVMGDLDDDGDLDLVTIVWSQLAYRLNTGGVLGPAVQISSFASGGGRAVDLGDADGDGDLDVYAVLANASLGTNPNDVLFLNDELDFTPMTAPDTAGVGDAVTAMDANQDGTAEFVVLNGLEGVGPVQVLRLASD